MSSSFLTVVPVTRGLSLLLATTALFGSGCSEDDLTEAARTAAQVPVAADLELRRLCVIFDSSDEGPGLPTGITPERIQRIGGRVRDR